MARGLLVAAIASIAVATAASDARACTGAECYVQAATLGEAPATGSSVLRFPQAIAYSPGAGTILVADQYGAVVQRFDRAATGWASWAATPTRASSGASASSAAWPPIGPATSTCSTPRTTRAGLRGGHGALAGGVGYHRPGRRAVPLGDNTGAGGLAIGRGATAWCCARPTRRATARRPAG